MKSSSKPDRLKSFEALGALVKKGELGLANPNHCGPAKQDDSRRIPASKPPESNGGDPDQERRIFLAAMADVTPFRRQNRQGSVTPRFKSGRRNEDPDTEVFRKLNDLVETGDGFVVALTPEYQEGIGYQVHPMVAEKLHRGDYSIQDHIDLHGCGVAEAKAALDAFLAQSIATRKRAVLVVHGRGLSSPRGPVLKEKVREWLTTGCWRKWVLAFTSARRYDGGAGATYVLLRERPAPRKGKTIFV